MYRRARDIEPGRRQHRIGASMTLSRQGPAVREQRIVELETMLNSPLPRDYRAFLTRSNGGRPTPDTIDIPGLPESPSDVKVLFGIDRAIESERLDWNLSTLSERLEPGVLPIAGDSGGSVYCLSLRAKDYGAISYCDLQSVFADYEARPQYYPVAPNFESFLSRLRAFED